MNKPWLISFVILSFLLLGLIKSHRIQILESYYKNEKMLKLGHFEKFKKSTTKENLLFIKLWESIIIGKSRSLPKEIKVPYNALGMAHIFTPSGFHLTAVLLPFMKIIKKNKYQLIFIILVGSLITFLPGFNALKRMVLIKGSQKLLGTQTGFILALLLDVFWGSFQSAPLSFSYSMLFLAIIYSGAKGFALIFWFFCGQIIISFFQESYIPLILIVFSPVINFVFSFLLPILFGLTFPTGEWALETGLFLLKKVHGLVEFLSTLSKAFPIIEVHVGIICVLIFVLSRKWKLSMITILFISNTLNFKVDNYPASSQYQFKPQGKIKKIINKEKETIAYYKEGRCRLKLVQGIWIENCSPIRRSNHIKIKKLSYL